MIHLYCKSDMIPRITRGILTFEEQPKMERDYIHCTFESLDEYLDDLIISNTGELKDTSDSWDDMYVIKNSRNNHKPVMAVSLGVLRWNMELRFQFVHELGRRNGLYIEIE